MWYQAANFAGVFGKNENALLGSLRAGHFLFDATTQNGPTWAFVVRDTGSRGAAGG
jgi:uncharacterized membrane protein